MGTSRNTIKTFNQPMIYILLVIIAIGVLLQSREGKAILSWAQNAIGVVALVVAGFFIVVIAVALLPVAGS